MDPNETLRLLRERLDRFAAGNATHDDYEAIADYAMALDEWLSRGGFPPAPWDRAWQAQRIASERAL